MSRGVRDYEVKRIVIDVRKGTAAGNVWRVERHGARYLFIGPDPGGLLFTSTEAKDWTEATAFARGVWGSMDEVRRDLWYGPSGRYARFAAGEAA